MSRFPGPWVLEFFEENRQQNMSFRFIQIRRSLVALGAFSITKIYSDPMVWNQSSQGPILNPSKGFCIGAGSIFI